MSKEQKKILVAMVIAVVVISILIAAYFKILISYIQTFFGTTAQPGEG